MEVLTTLVGLYMIYALVHFLVIQHSKSWKERSTYEKVVTWIGIFVILSLFYSIYE